MRIITALVLTAVLAITIIGGCEPDQRGIKASPKTEPEFDSRVGYNENYYDDQYTEDYQYTDSERSEEFEMITVYFDYDKFELTPEALDIMSSNADHLMSNPIKVILIEGHCDERGTEEYNLALGEKRALEVREYLVKYGIDPKRISIVSYGESIPAEFGQGEKVWSKNRRAEFTVLSQ